MALRCKPGELCVIVNNRPELDGHFVIVDCVMTLDTHMCPGCRSSARYWKHTPVPVGSQECYATCDCFLRPIRDPGPDAVDEMVLRIPVPSTAKEPA